MSTWFSNFNAADAISNFKASDAFEKLNEISTKVQETVQESLPLEDDLIKKLTLRSDDLQAEHDLIDAQETRKEMVRDYLSKLLPWETNDEARVILIEECREAIQDMAMKGETFTGPFELPEGVEKMFSENSDMSEATEESKAEAAKKLEKMGTLPQLLHDFDLDAHVGLIEKLFQVDEELKMTHSLLESAGKTEKVFWKNYFFHCAYVRYTKGLSLEEIWSIQTEPVANSTESSFHEGDDANASVEINFEQETDIDNISASSLKQDDDGEEEKAYMPSAKSTGEFELVDAEESTIQLDDSELDELDAEIARELADIDNLWKRGVP